MVVALIAACMGIAAIHRGARVDCGSAWISGTCFERSTSQAPRLIPAVRLVDDIMPRTTQARIASSCRILWELSRNCVHSIARRKVAEVAGALATMSGAYGALRGLIVDHKSSLHSSFGVAGSVVADDPLHADGPDFGCPVGGFRCSGEHSTPLRH